MFCLFLFACFKTGSYQVAVVSNTQIPLLLLLKHGDWSVHYTWLFVLRHRGLIMLLALAPNTNFQSQTEKGKGTNSPTLHSLPFPRSIQIKENGFVFVGLWSPAPTSFHHTCVLCDAGQATSLSFILNYGLNEILFVSLAPVSILLFFPTGS